MGRLTGKRALMTGAGGLLGSDLCRAFAAEGADLVLTTRTVEKLAPLVKDVEAMGRRAVAVGADMTVSTDLDRLAQVAWEAFDGIDVVLFSAQPPQPRLGSLLDCAEDDFLEQMQSIVWGPLHLMRALAPRMIAAGHGGSIVTVISSTGFDPFPGYGAYGMAKGALWTMTRYMAAEWGQFGIRANAFNPGLVATTGEVEEHTTMVRNAGVLDRTALGRVGTNAECIGAALHFASDESSFTSGQKIFVDGGRY